MAYVLTPPRWVMTAREAYNTTLSMNISEITAVEFYREDAREEIVDKKQKNINAV